MNHHNYGFTNKRALFLINRKKKNIQNFILISENLALVHIHQAQKNYIKKKGIRKSTRANI